jgi:hypothetical protein
VLSATVVSATRRVLSCTNMPPPFDPAALPTTSEPSTLISTRDSPHIPPARAAATTNVSAETGRKDPIRELLEGLMKERAEAISGSFYAGVCWRMLIQRG